MERKTFRFPSDISYLLILITSKDQAEDVVLDDLFSKASCAHSSSPIMWLETSLEGHFGPPAWLQLNFWWLQPKWQHDYRREIMNYSFVGNCQVHVMTSLCLFQCGPAGPHLVQHLVDRCSSPRPPTEFWPRRFVKPQNISWCVRCSRYLEWKSYLIMFDDHPSQPPPNVEQMHRRRWRSSFMILWHKSTAL